MAARASLVLLLIIYLGFISLGLPDGTLGVAWPAMHRDLGLPIGVAGTVIIVGTLLSAIAAFSSGRIIARFGTGPVVLVSCALTGSAMMILAHAEGLMWLLAAAIPLGFGAGAVDASLNGYVARHYTGKHMNWLHACWGIGATAGPLVMARVLSSDAGWRGGYFAIALAQLTLAVVFFLTLRLWRQVPERTFSDGHDSHASGRSPVTAANSTAGWLSVGIFAVYVSVEMTMGLWAGSILVLSRQIRPEYAAVCVAAFYGAITTGRVLVGFVVDRWGNRAVIACGTIVALAGGLWFTAVTSALFAGAALVVLGLGFSPVYPCLMHEVPRRFAPDAVQVIIGRQSGAAAVGSASLPPAAGWLAGVSLEGIAWSVVAGIVVLIVSIRRLDRIT